MKLSLQVLAKLLSKTVEAAEHLVAHIALPAFTEVHGANQPQFSQHLAFRAYAINVIRLIENTAIGVQIP